MTTSQEIFGDKDFANLLFNCATVSKDKNLLSVFPTLGQLPSFRKELPGLDKNMLIRYIIYAYDRKSPIVQQFLNDEVKRKTLAAQYAGFEADAETGCFDYEVDKIMKCQNNDVNVMIIDFVRQFGHDFSVLIVGNESLYKTLALMNNEIDGDKRDDLQKEKTRGEIWEQALKKQKQLKLLAEEYLNDRNPYLREQLFSTIDESERIKIPLTVEDWVDEA